MRLTTVLAFAAGVAAAPPSFPLPDGFPNPSRGQLSAIEKTAGGSLGDYPLPTTLTPAAITSLELLANNELFEVAFFSELLSNITNTVTGYGFSDLEPFDRDLIIKSLTAILKVAYSPGLLDPLHL